MGNWIVIGIFLVLVGISAYFLRKRRKQGGCGCGCAGCTMGCTEGKRERHAKTEEKPERKK